VIRRLVLVTAMAVSVMTAAAGAVADTGSVSVTPVSRLRFPERGYLVGLPTNKQLTAADVVIRENGQPVRDPSFVPAGAAAERFGVLLVIDSSNSMRGKPILDAFNAARRFADRLLPSEQVGLVTFSSGSRLIQKPTDQAHTVSAALAHVPSTGQGTHIYDALAQALAVIRDSRLSGSAIVLLSDGADTGSKAAETQLITRAQRQHVRIFTIGLRSGSFRSAPLQRLARGTGARFAEATSSAGLAPVFDQLGQALAREYFLRYRSEANPGVHVVLTVKVRGEGNSTLTYLAPAVSAVPPFHRSLWVRFWGSAASLVFISLLIAGLAGLGMAMLLRRKPSTVGARIAEFATLVSEQDGSADGEKPLLSTRLLGGTERSLARTQWWTRFREELAIANIEISAEQMLGLAIVGTLLVALVLYMISPVFSIFGLAVPFLVRSYCKRELHKVRAAFEDQLPDNLQVLASALRAGHSFVGALSVVAADSSEPSKREFTRVVADEQLGVPLEDSLREVSRRMANNDLEQVALVAELQRQTGGNMAEVLDRVIETIRGRFDLRRLIRTLTAQGRMARWILTLLPVSLALFITLINPSYISPLFTTAGGQIILTVAAVMVISGSIAIKRIVDIKV
jgi:tight adherence protein B